MFKLMAAFKPMELGFPEETEDNQELPITFPSLNLVLHPQINVVQ
jgi:hypothetical protein